MNLQNIFNQIETADPEFYERTSARRHVLKNIGRAAALTAIPFALGSVLKKAYGQLTNTIADVLNFALTLEYLEAKFYAEGNAKSGLIATTDQSIFIRIGQDEAKHVTFLKNTLVSLGQTPVSEPNFDLTGGGTFPTVLSNYDTFLAVAQAFEDTGVRAYKGQAPNLMSSPDVLTAALRIHSVEARHAAQIRLLRDKSPYIIGTNSEIQNAAVDGVYAGEANTNQAGVEIVNINAAATTTNIASQYFDEPLTKAAVLAIVDPFILP